MKTILGMRTLRGASVEWVWGVVLLGCLGMGMWGMPVRCGADAGDLHFQSDTFAAEAAALVPAFRPLQLAAPPTPQERIVLGDWTSKIAWTPHIPVSAATLPDGRILTFASNQRTTFPSGPEFTYAATWDPATGNFVEYNHTNHDMFCGALVMLPDGRVLVNGGRATTVRSSLFDWRSNTWTRTPDMNDPRWYNTSVALPSGEVWTASGSGGSSTSERWSSAIGWSRLTGIDWTPILNEPGYINIWHPFMLLAPDGRLIHFGPTDTMHWVNPSGAGQLSNAGVVVPGTHYPKEGSWVMYDEGRILVAGGGANTSANPSDSTTGTSSALAYTVDVNGVNPVVTPAASMNYPRQFANATVLPNGEVMVMGGNTSGLKFNDTGSVLTPEIWNPNSGQWRTVADMSVPRNYHSLSLLLPDGRVLSGGGGLGGNSADHQDVQIFTPPNLFNADGSLAVRPVISSAPAVIGVGTKFVVSASAGMSQFVIIKMSAITHSVNTDLRRLVLPFVENSPGNYTLTARPNLNVMTPGYWMLFGINGAGVHSVSRILRVDSTAAVQVAAVGNQSTYVNQAVSLPMVATGPAGAAYSWTMTGAPAGLSIHPATGLISGVGTVTGTSNVRVTVTDGLTVASTTFTWLVQPQTVSQNFGSFTSAAGLSVAGRAAVTSGVLRLTTNGLNLVGAAYLSNAIPVGPSTSFSTRFVFRIHGTADGADGMAFVVQGAGATSVGSGGNGLGYNGLLKSVAVELDNYQGTGDPSGNHVGIVSGGNATSHLATWNAGWDLENEVAHTVWVDYDGNSNQMRVYVAQGIVAQRPGTPQLTATLDLPAVVGGAAWFGFTAATGGAGNNHDVQSWSLSVNALALPAQPVLTTPAAQVGVAGVSGSLQMQATDANGDLLTWSATGLPGGLSIQPATGLISGVPTSAGSFNPTVTVQDGNTLPVSTTFAWTINAPLTVQPISGVAVASGSVVALNVQSGGGLNPQYKWSFGDGTADTAFGASSGTTHIFANPGRYVVTATVKDATGRQLTASYRQAVYAPLTAAKPTRSSSMLYETRAGANARLWTVNPDNDSVTAFDVVTRAKLVEVPVGISPRTIARATDGRIWVVNYQSATISILGTNGVVTQTVVLPRGSRPFAVVFDPAGANAYVSLESLGRVLKLNPTTGATVASLDLGQDVRHLSVTADGAQLWVSRFVTPRVPGEEGVAPQTTVGTNRYGGEVVVVNAAALTVNRKVVLEHGEKPDTSNSARGIPNYLGAAVISPDGLTAWVPSKQDNIKRGTLRSGGVLTHDMSIRSVASRIVISTLTEDTASRVDFDNAGIASASAFDAQGNYLFTALEGSREVAVADVWARQEILRFDAGRAPQGILMAPDNRTLYVHNFMDRTVTVHDLGTLMAGGETPPPAPVVLSCVAAEKLDPVVLLGKKHFYDAKDTRLAFQQYISCASCHNDGGQDGRVWDFTQFGEGLRNTITLRGHGGVDQGPLHWSGNFDEVQDFEGQIRVFAGGTGLMSDADFHAGTREQPLGDPKAGVSADLDALSAYLSSLKSQGDSPYRNGDGTLTAAGVAGRALFAQFQCAQCHGGRAFTDSGLGVFHNVGTLKPASGGRMGAVLVGLDTPTLLGVWNTGPYLHDGSALTLEDAIAAHSGLSTTAADRGNLAAYLRQLDDAAGSDVSNGLKAQYFTGRVFSPVVLERVDGTVNFDWGTGSPGGGVPVDNFSVRWTGRVEPQTSEAYTFYARTDDGVRLWINGQLILDNWIDQSPAEKASVAVNLKAGVKYELKMEYYENGGGAVAQLSWSSASVAKQIIPAARLFAPLPVVPTITWPAPAPIVYGTALGATQLNATADVAGNFSYTPAAGTVLNAAASSPLTVVFTPADLSGAVAVAKTVNVQVQPKALTITADNKSRTYGSANPVLTVRYAGWVNGDTPASLDVPANVGTVATAASAVGNYAITLGGASDPNYAITHVAGVLSVTPAPLGVRADNKTRLKGAANPALTASYFGFVNGDTFASLSPQVTLGTVATVSSPAGNYPITVGGAGSLNYAITYTNGVLTVNEPTVVSVVLAPLTSSITVGQTQTLKVQATWSDNSVSDVTSSAVWGTSNPAVAVVESPGVIRGVGAGSASVTATFQGQSAGASLQVQPGMVTRLFQNGTSIGILDAGPASQYPSTLEVAGMVGPIIKATVSLNGVSHTYPGDVDMLLVSPSGTQILLMSDAGKSGALNGVQLVLDDAAADSLPETGQIVSGTFKPTNFGAADSFPSPAPAGPYATSLSALAGGSPNGTWSLFVVDDAAEDTGVISGGWSLTLTTGINAPPSLNDLADVNVDEDQTAGPILVTVQDSETDAASLVVTATSSNTELVDGSGFQWSGAGGTRSLTIRPLPNASGNAIITVSVSDGQSTVVDTFRFVVAPVNDAPTIAGLTDLSLQAGVTSPPIPFVISDPETAPGGLAVSASSSQAGVVSSGGLVLGGTGSQRTLQITPQAGVSGLTTITVQVGDGQWVRTRTFVVEVQNAAVPVVFSNPSGGTLADLSAANPYPSTIQVGSFSGILGGVKVSLMGIGHTYPSDLDILLVAPTGDAILLMSDAGGSPDMVNANLTFDDAASGAIPQGGPVVTGIYRPTDFGLGDLFPAPAPAGPYVGTLGGLAAKNPVGTWSLYIVDDEGVDVGTWTGGWTLTLVPLTPGLAELGSSRAAGGVALAEGTPLQLRVENALEVDGLTLGITGVAGEAFAVEYSSDLIRWTLLAEGTLGGVGARVVDASAEPERQRFYRLRPGVSRSSD